MLPIRLLLLLICPMRETWSRVARRGLSVGMIVKAVEKAVKTVKAVRIIDDEIYDEIMATNCLL